MIQIYILIIFECHEIEFHKHLKNMWIYKAKQFLFTRKKIQTKFIYCRRRCKWWTSGWHCKDTCQKHVQNIISLHESDESSNKNYSDLNLIMNSRNVKKKLKFKYLRSWNLRLKLYLVHYNYNVIKNIIITYFYTSLLMIGFEELMLIFYIWVPNLAIEVILKNNQFYTTFCYYL